MWQGVTFIVCVLFGGVAASYSYFVCILWRFGSISQVFCVYCVVVWQHVLGMVSVFCGGVATIFR